MLKSLGTEFKVGLFALVALVTLGYMLFVLSPDVFENRNYNSYYTILRNGVVINEFDNTPGKQSSRAGDPPTDLRQFTSGFIGLQNHSDTDLMDFQNIRVRAL